MNLRQVFPALLALAFVSVAAAAQQDMELKSRTNKLNEDLTAQILTIARDATGHKISASMRISNTGENTAFIAFTGRGSIMDLTEGFQFIVTEVKGAGWCDLTPISLCIGIPDIKQAFPFQNYTEIGPGRSITVISSWGLFHEGRASTSDHVSLAFDMIYRIVANPASDAELSDRQKLKQVHTGNLSFDNVKVREK
jgi:hypothetical protein